MLDQLLKFPSATVRAKTSELIAELVQNNPYCQREATKHLKRLLELVDGSTDEADRIKALYAVSCKFVHSVSLVGFSSFGRQKWEIIFSMNNYSQLSQIKKAWYRHFAYKKNGDYETTNPWTDPMLLASSYLFMEE